MLVLSRKNGESIKIGEDIEITIISSKNDQVKIGIRAPKNIGVYRKEVIEQIHQENILATKDFSKIIDLMKNEKK
ncbi:carbon storage regulator CsrA [Mesobacillus jeotgali]|uniref:Translational regulator CsrA n=1 Tax=Mesobacillus jeotgali TaxID=129985 RepID=A0ABY9VGA1_9BACI|nr:carbon storage regulator CsrA [Mesobacillus jeotgali]WNF22613.1 carbon storage regulator CsrA [Mesobacillus jeotgali]